MRQVPVRLITKLTKRAATGKRVIYFLPVAGKAASGEKIVSDVDENYELDENYQFSKNYEFDTDG